MQSLDFSGSEEDLFAFIELVDIDPSMIYKEESVIINGKNVKVKKSVMDKETYAQMKSAYQKLITEVKLKSGNGLLMFFAQHERYIAYLKKQYTNEITEELNRLRMKGVTTLNYKEYLK